MAKINSNRKGKTGEREFANKLRETIDPSSRRGVQYSGGPDSPDIQTDLPLHFECKRIKRFAGYKYMEQAEGDCGDKTPIVAIRADRQEWLIMIKFDDFVDLWNGKLKYENIK